MTSASRSRRVGHGADSREHGFVIVGVVMLVLALTILGLSLFSLSSFESQFFGRSLDRQQAFFAATSGMEQAKFNLLRGGRLEDAAFGLPSASVDSARAWQVVGTDTLSTGPVTWSVPVHVDVYGRARGARSALGGTFTPVVQTDYYRRLITTSGAVTLDWSGTRDFSVQAVGKIYEASTNDAWTYHLAPPPPDSLRHGQTWILDPPVLSFIAARPGLPSAGYSSTGGNPVVTLDAAGLSPGYFTFDMPSSPFSFEYVGGTFSIRVNGPAVWVLPRGFHAFTHLSIESMGSDPNTCLVMVAGRADAPYSTVGIWSENGTFESDIPVILVTDGRCILYRGTDITDLEIPYLSVYASRVELQGPESGPPWVLRHDLDASEDDPGGLIDLLASWGALPSGNPVSTGLALIPGTWRETGN